MIRDVSQFAHNLLFCRSRLNLQQTVRSEKQTSKVPTGKTLAIASIVNQQKMEKQIYFYALYCVGVRELDKEISKNCGNQVEENETERESRAVSRYYWETVYC